MTDNVKVIPLTPLRKVIAARMTDAKQTIPHYRVGADIEMDALFALRQQFNEEHPNTKVSVNDFIIKACATALIENPALNIQLIDNEIHQYPQADISVVIAVEGGLSTPVIRYANHKSVQTIAEEVKELSARAQQGSLRIDEILGGTFSVSNLGMYGVDQFDAIINPPQCAILAVGGAKPQAVIREDEIKTARVMRVTLSLDHRAIDGATGAQFLSVLREILQFPEQLLKNVGRQS